MPSLESLEQVRRIGTCKNDPHPTAAVAFSPDGRWLATCSADGVLNFWNETVGFDKPRHSRRRDAGIYTALSWSHDARYLACAMGGGGVEIWDARNVQVAWREFPQKDVVCLAWAPHDLRLAYGGTDGIVHFRNFTNGWDNRDLDREQGIGHMHPLRSIAWSPDGRQVVTGTDGGTLGVWTDSPVDNQLRQALSSGGSFAHQGPVLGLTWARHANVLVSVSDDYRMRLWDVAESRLLQTIELEDTPLDAQFALGDRLLVVQCLDHIRFFRCGPLREIQVCEAVAAIEPRSTLAICATRSLLACVHALNCSIDVLKVDFAGLLRASELSQKSHRVAGVALVGRAASGRTNLALALTGAGFQPDIEQHACRVHMLRLPPVAIDSHHDETREVAFWDLPSGSQHGTEDHLLVQRIHAPEPAVTVLLLDALPGRAPRSVENLQHWKSILHAHRWALQPNGGATLVVATLCDQLAWFPSTADVALIAQQLGIDKLFLSSAKQAIGISELRQAILTAIEWSRTDVAQSADLVSLLQNHLADEREARKDLLSMQEVLGNFVRAHSFLPANLIAEDQLRAAMRVLQTRGAIERFTLQDYILLRPEYFHTYALALLAAARLDPTGMGQLALQQAELGRGEHLKIPEGRRLNNQRQELRLLSAIIDELVHKEVAQKVSADGTGFLVFPRSLTRVAANLPASSDCPAVFTYRGAVEDVYSSLIVRLLNLNAFYSYQELWKNAAWFKASNGGQCGLALEVEASGDEARVTVFFREDPSVATMNGFIDYVQQHIHQRGVEVRTMRREIVIDTDAEPDIFLCHRCTQQATLRSIESIADELRAAGIHTWLAEQELQAGETGERRRLKLEQSSIAVVFFDGEMSAELRADVGTLERHGCEIIPVLLGRGSQYPDLLEKKYVPVDFTNYGSKPLGRLINGIRRMQKLVAEARAADSKRHVFLSYAHADKQLVEPLRQALAKRGHRVWWDENIQGGERWADIIYQAMGESYAIVLCWSTSLARRDRSWVFKELRHAAKLFSQLRPDRVFIVPVKLEVCEEPRFSIDELDLASLQWIELGDAGIDRLVRTLDRARSQSRAHARSPQLLASHETV